MSVPAQHRSRQRPVTWQGSALPAEVGGPRTPASTPQQRAAESGPVAELIGRGAGHRGRRWWWLAALCVVAVAAAFVWRAQSAPRDSTEYVSVPVKRGDLQATVVATGTLEPRDQVEVGAELSGRVVAVNADFNDAVKEGQVLCQLDPQQWRAAVEQASAQLAANRASLDSARAARREAELNLQRTELLLGEGLATTQAFEAARSAAERARANVQLSISQIAVASAALESAQTSLRKTIIRSPMDGVVLSRTVEPGQTVAATLSAPLLFVLARDLKQMELRVQIDEADIGQIAPGQAASFTVDTYPARRFPAQLTTIYNIAKTENNVVTYEARLQVDNSELALRPGMTATVTVVTAAREDVLLVPNAALRFTPPFALATATRGPAMPMMGRRSPPPRRASEPEPGPRVWIVGVAGPEARQVGLGLSDGEWTEVSGEGLEAGARVLTDVIVRVD